ncbi:MAG: DUF962 domain-containing protein [Bdellovibrionota bacterium]
MNRKFNSYEEFYQFYLREHSKAQTRIFHCIGTLLGLGFLFFAIWQHRWGLILWGFLAGYAVAWLSHFLIEKNRPATIKYPFYSFISDFRMLFDTVTNKLPLNKDIPKIK